MRTSGMAAFCGFFVAPAALAGLVLGAACASEQSTPADGTATSTGTATGTSTGSGGAGGGGSTGVGAGGAGGVGAGGAGGVGAGSSGRTGLEGFCDHYKECGGTYYGTAQDCIDASLDYWGECRRAELDAFGDCMLTIDCDDWSPDTYNPSSTDCAEEWQAVQSASC